jgi:hypothetical protein
MAAKKYSHSTNIMISEPVADLVADLADRESLSKAQVMRSLLHAGIRKAGYGYVLDGTDARPNPTAALGPADSTPTAP